MIQRSGVTTSREMDALSGPTKAKGSEPVACARIFADGRSVAEHDGAAARVCRRDALDGPPQPPAEHLPGLGTGDHVPALLGHDLREDRIAVGRLHAQQAALPLAEEHLTQIGLDDGRHAAAGDEGRRRLDRALQGGDVQGVEGLLRQPEADLLGLVATGLGERRVALALDELEGLALQRVGRRAVADEPQLGGAGRADIGPLAEATGRSRSTSRTPSVGTLSEGGAPRCRRRRRCHGRRV